MRKIATISLLVLLLAGLVEYTNGQPISNLQKTMIEEEVNSVFRSMIKAAESLDYNTLKQGVDDKNHAGFIVNGVYYSQFDSLISNMKSKSQGVSKQTISIQKEKITVLSESIVLLSAYGETLLEVTNSNPFSAKFFWSFVYEKKNGSWKVIQSHQSSSK